MKRVYLASILLLAMKSISYADEWSLKDKNTLRFDEPVEQSDIARFIYFGRRASSIFTGRVQHLLIKRKLLNTPLALCLILLSAVQLDQFAILLSLKSNYNEKKRYELVRYMLASLLILFLSGLAHAQTNTFPTKTIESVIAEARHYAKEKEIDLGDKFIQKAEYQNNLQSKNKRPYWSIYWINKKITKGGGVELRLYPDGSFEEQYYK